MSNSIYENLLNIGVHKYQSCDLWIRCLNYIIPLSNWSTHWSNQPKVTTTSPSCLAGLQTCSTIASCNIYSDETCLYGHVGNEVSFFHCPHAYCVQHIGKWRILSGWTICRQLEIKFEYSLAISSSRIVSPKILSPCWCCCCLGGDDERRDEGPQNCSLGLSTVFGKPRSQHSR